PRSHQQLDAGQTFRKRTLQCHRVLSFSVERPATELIVSVVRQGSNQRELANTVAQGQQTLVVVQQDQALLAELSRHAAMVVTKVNAPRRGVAIGAFEESQLFFDRQNAPHRLVDESDVYEASFD